jgi:hypothetical protein
MATNDL